MNSTINVLSENKLYEISHKAFGYNNIRTELVVRFNNDSFSFKVTENDQVWTLTWTGLEGVRALQ